MGAARGAAVPIPLPCGGNGRCLNCRVKVVSGDAPATAADRRAFGPEQLDAGFRLACCARVQGDLVVDYHVGAVAGKAPLRGSCCSSATVPCPP